VGIDVLADQEHKVATKILQGASAVSKRIAEEHKKMTALLQCTNGRISKHLAELERYRHRAQNPVLGMVLGVKRGEAVGRNRGLLQAAAQGRRLEREQGDGGDQRRDTLELEAAARKYMERMHAQAPPVQSRTQMETEMQPADAGAAAALQQEEEEEEQAEAKRRLAGLQSNPGLASGSFAGGPIEPMEVTCREGEDARAVAKEKERGTVVSPRSSVMPAVNRSAARPGIGVSGGVTKKAAPKVSLRKLGLRSAVWSAAELHEKIEERPVLPSYPSEEEEEEESEEEEEEESEGEGEDTVEGSLMAEDEDDGDCD
jgi:hypothetical protein